MRQREPSSSRHQLISLFDLVFDAPPFDFASEETNKPYGKVDGVTNRRQPPRLAGDGIVEAPYSCEPHLDEPQNQIACSVADRATSGWRDEDGYNRPRQAEREEQPPVASRANVPQAD